MRELAALLKDWPQAEFNIEGNPFHNLMDFVRERAAAAGTFVPDSVGPVHLATTAGSSRRTARAWRR